MLNTLFEQLHTGKQAVERLDKTVESWLKMTTAAESSHPEKSDFGTFLKQVHLKHAQEGQISSDSSIEVHAEGSALSLDIQEVSKEPVQLLSELLPQAPKVLEFATVLTGESSPQIKPDLLDMETTAPQKQVVDEQFINRLMALLSQLPQISQDSSVSHKSTRPQLHHLQDVLQHVEKINFAELKSPETLTQLFEALQDNFSQSSKQQIKTPQQAVFDPFQFETTPRSDKSILLQGNPLQDVAKTLFKVLSEKLPADVLTELKTNLSSLKLISSPEIALADVKPVSLLPKKLPLLRTVQEHQVLSELQKPFANDVKEARIENEFLKEAFTTLPEMKQVTQANISLDLSAIEPSLVGILSSSKLSLSQISLDLSPSVKAPDLSLALPVTVQSQAVDAVRQAMQAGRHELVMTLEPEHLGSMRVNITHQTISGIEKITAKIFVESPEARQDLETKFSQLEDRLIRQGINKIEIIQANDKSQFAKEQFAQPRQNESQQNNNFASFQSNQNASSQNHRNAFAQRDFTGTHSGQDPALLASDLEQVLAVSSSLNHAHDGQVNLSV